MGKRTLQWQGHMPAMCPTKGSIPALEDPQRSTRQGALGSCEHCQLWVWFPVPWSMAQVSQALHDLEHSQFPGSWIEPLARLAEKSWWNLQRITREPHTYKYKQKNISLHGPPLKPCSHIQQKRKSLFNINMHFSSAENFHKNAFDLFILVGEDTPFGHRED